MKKNIILSILLIALFLCFVGCKSDTDNVVDSESTSTNSSINFSKDTSKDVSSLFSEETGKRSLGMFSFGIVTDSSEMQVYQYKGKEMHIPFKVKGMDKKVISDFGLMVFVDGIAQPYKIQKKNGAIGEEKYMQKFSLKYEETEFFDIVFTPVTGKKGSKVGVVMATILKPDFMPENKEKANYGAYHSLNAILPQEIQFECEPLIQKEPIGFKESKLEEIPQTIKDKSKFIQNTDSIDSLDEGVNIDLISMEGDTKLFNAKNKKVKLKLVLYGGIEAAYRTTIFVNHIPVKVMGADYIETKTKKGKMTTVEFELDTSNYNELNTIYSITVPSGKDYLAVEYFPIKTKSALLVNN